MMRFLKNKLTTLGAVRIIGSKLCKKTRTEFHAAKSILYMQDPDRRVSYLKLSQMQLSFLLKGKKHRLIDELQLAPYLMDTIRRCIAIIIVLIYSGGSTVSLWAQRKDTDAKISHSNYVRSAIGQREKVSDANIRIRYAFNPEDITDKSTWIDEGQLKIAQDMTDYSSFFVEVNEDSLANWFNIHGRNVAYPPARWIQGHRPDYWIEYQYSQITTKNGILTEWATMPRALDSENLYYTENLPLFNWQIETDTDTICGYECFKATCHWRGRDFTAWFTPDIPVEYGPWKFGGLPGLIMKVYDKDGLYNFEAVAVENGNFPIYAPRGNRYKLSSRDKVWKLQRALNENYFKAADHYIINAKTGQVISSRQHPYFQLELE